MKQTEPAPLPSAFPLYTQATTPVTPAKGPPHADSKQSGVLAKRISKLMPKMKAPKGIMSNQNVHVSHNKNKKHPNPVTYW